jgi:methylthioribose-1-phosphate isomerase
MAAQNLREARPTAVNLMNAVDRLADALAQPTAASRTAALVAEAESIFDEDVALCAAMGQRGADLIQDGDSVLTHCNTGGLATAGIGTALGAVRRAHEQGKRIHVFVDETRPLLQGARLTAWELGKLKIPYTLICDNMAGFLMSQGKINRIFVGADRIAANGDVANKIGTYSVAVLAHHHRVPFYVVAPRTTLDAACPSGKMIPIEQRKPEEVRAGKSPADCAVWNPAFDVTPRELITAIVLDDRLI